MSVLPTAQMSEEQAAIHLAELVKLQEQLQVLKNQESLLRSALFKHYFPDPKKLKEGVNSLPLNAGWTLKADYRINRTIDQASLAANRERLLEANIPLDDVVQLKPELRIGAYRKLTDEQKLLFDENMTSKPGLPGLTLVPPKTKNNSSE